MQIPCSVQRALPPTFAPSRPRSPRRHFVLSQQSVKKDRVVLRRRPPTPFNGARLSHRMPKNRHAINDKLDDVLSGQQSDEVDGLQALLSLPMSPAKSPTRSPPLRATPGGAGLVGSPSPLRPASS